MTDEYSCSPNSVLIANQKMWAERFNKLNHENHRNTKRREDRLKEKQEQQKEKPEFDFDLGGPI